EAESLFSHALERQALTCGMRRMRAGAVRLDASAVERIAQFLSPEQSADLVQEIINRRGTSTRGNANRATALASLAPWLAGRDRQRAIAEAIRELMWISETASKQKKRVTTRGSASTHTAHKSKRQPGIRGAKTALVFDDYHEMDEGIDLLFNSYVEDASDL